MLKLVSRLGSITLSAAFVGVLAGTALAPARANDANVTVVASNWQFAPASVIAHVGQPITLQLSSKEGVHGIKSDDLGIPLTTLVPGKTVTVTFTPKKAGTYVVHCAIPCGPGHANMAFTVKVVD